MQSQGIEQWLREGIAAAQAGQKDQARQLLLQVIAQNQETESAWLWLSDVVDDPKEKQICLENVLALNPENTAAQDGLQRLREQELVSAYKAEDVQRPVHVAGPDSPRVEIDPFGCPYCGAPLSGEKPRCQHCGRSVEVRLRRHPGGAALLRAVIFFCLLGVAALLEGYLVSEVVNAEPFPDWVSRSALHLAIGQASFSPEGITDDLANLADLLILVHNVLAGLCIAAAAGLALRSRLAYIGSFVLTSLLVAAGLAGFLTGLTGLLPALLLAGMAAITVKWLADCAMAFEWQVRPYNASLDRNLRDGVEFYHRGQRYGEMGMWAKAAAHWQTATQLAPDQAHYYLALANAYVQMGYPNAAVAETDRALAVAPGDTKVQAFRDSLNRLPESQIS